MLQDQSSHLPKTLRGGVIDKASLVMRRCALIVSHSSLNPPQRVARYT